VQAAFFVSPDSPFDEHDLAFEYLDPGDAPGVDAAAGVEVRQVLAFGEFGPVGMATDQHFAIGFDPPVVHFLDLVPLIDILGRAGRILEPNDMHQAPEIAHQQHRDNPELVIHQITLVAMDDQDFLASLPIAQNQRFAGSRFSNRTFSSSVYSSNSNESSS